MPVLKRLNGSKPARSPELASAVCRFIADGFSLRYACSELGFSHGWFNKWLLEDETIRSQYAQARDCQADKYADEIVEMADSAIGKPNEIVTAIRNAIDARKWTAAKLKPKVYGDRPAEVNFNQTLNCIVLSPEKQQELQERRRKLLEG